MGDDSPRLAEPVGMCLCPAWAHGPGCMRHALPSPVPALAAPPQRKQSRPDAITIGCRVRVVGGLEGHDGREGRVVNFLKRENRVTLDLSGARLVVNVAQVEKIQKEELALPTWSARAQTAQPGPRRRGTWPCRPKTRSKSPPKLDPEALRFTEQDERAKVTLPSKVRLLGKYPRLQGADALLVLYELDEAQRRVADLGTHLRAREVELTQLTQVMERTLKQRNTTGCSHMRRRAKKHSKMQTWGVWRDFVEHEQERREQKRQRAEAAEKARLALLELEEQQRREKETVCGMAANLSAQQERQARLEERNHTLEQENEALRKEVVAVEEKFNAKALALKGGIEVLEGKVAKLEEQLEEREQELRDKKNSLRNLQRAQTQQMKRLADLEQERLDPRALQDRLLSTDLQLPAAQRAAVQGMQGLPGTGEWDAVLNANEYHVNAGFRGQRNEKMNSRDRVAMFGNRLDFAEGLVACNGWPVVIDDEVCGGDEAIEDQMRREFLLCQDPRVIRLKSSSYKSSYQLVQSDLQTEWEFAACPVPGKTYPGQFGHADVSTQDILVSRSPAPLDAFVAHNLAQRAGLSRSEVLALRLSTGFCHQTLNGALREERLKKGKAFCPKWIFLDMPLILENILRAAGGTRWRAALRSDWSRIWHQVTKDLSVSDLFATKMDEIMAGVAPGPTTAILINSQEKRVVILDFTVKGDVWMEWDEVGEGYFWQTKTEEELLEEAKTKRETQRKNLMKRRREEEARRKAAEEEEMRLYEEKMEEIRRKRLAGEEIAPQSIPEPPSSAPSRSTTQGNFSENAGDGDLRCEETHRDIAEAYAEMKENMSRLLANSDEPWSVSVCPIIADSLGMLPVEAHRRGESWSGQLSRAGTKASEKLLPIHASPLVASSSVPRAQNQSSWPGCGGGGVMAPPHDWCCHKTSTQTDEKEAAAAREEASTASIQCGRAGCVCQLAKALDMPEDGKLGLAQALINGVVAGGCGKQEYGACKDSMKCAACKKGELWKCGFRKQKGCVRCAQGADAFSVTISTLGSALVKLARNTEPPDEPLFRGIEDLALPMSVLERQAVDCPFLGSAYLPCRNTFVEKGFMSTSSCRDVARLYTGANKCPTNCLGENICQCWDSDRGMCQKHVGVVLEIDTDTLRGYVANISWVSQWPGEEEHLVMACSHLYVKGMRRDGQINVVRLGHRVPQRFCGEDLCMLTIAGIGKGGQNMLSSVAKKLKYEALALMHRSPLLDPLTVSSLCDKAIQHTAVGQALPQFREQNHLLVQGFMTFLCDVAAQHVRYAEALLMQVRLLHVDFVKNRHGKASAGAADGDDSRQATENDIQDVGLSTGIETAEEAVERQSINTGSLGAEQSRWVQARLGHMIGHLDSVVALALRLYARLGFRDVDLPQVTKLYEMQLALCKLNGTSQDRMSSVYESKGDVLRSSCKIEHLEGSAAAYFTSLKLRRMPMNSLARIQLLFKRALVSVRLREKKNESSLSEGYDEPLKELMTCLGLLNQTQENGERALLLKAQVHASVGEVLYAHVPGKTQDAVLSLLQALRIQVRFKVEIRETLRHLHIIWSKVTDEDHESHRLLPCSVVQILAEVSERDLVDPNTLAQHLRHAPDDDHWDNEKSFLTLFRVWGLRAMRSCLGHKTELVWQEVVQIIEVVMLTMEGIAAHEEGTTEAILTLAQCLQHTDVWLNLRTHAPNRATQTQERMSRLCWRALRIHGGSALLHTVALETIHRVMTDTAPVTAGRPKTGVRIADVKEEDLMMHHHAVFQCMLDSLDSETLHGDSSRFDVSSATRSQATLQALEVLMAVSESDRVLKLHDLTQVEAVLQRHHDSQEADTAKGKSIQELCNVILERFRSGSQVVAGPDERGTESNQADQTTERLEGEAEAEAEELIAAARLWIETMRAGGHIDLGQARADITRAVMLLDGSKDNQAVELWQLSHQLAAMDGLDVLKRKLDQDDLPGAQAARALVGGEGVHGGDDFMEAIQPRLFALDAALDSAMERRAREDAQRRHVAAGLQALRWAQTALASTNIQSVLDSFSEVLQESMEAADVSLDVGLERVGGATRSSANDGMVAQLPEHEQEKDAKEAGAEAGTDITSDGGISHTLPAMEPEQGIGDASATTLVLAHSRSCADDSALSGKAAVQVMELAKVERASSPFAPLSDAREKLAEARHKFEISGEDHAMEIVAAEEDLMSFVVTAKSFLVEHVRNHLLYGQIRDGKHCAVVGTGMIEEAGFCSTLGELDLERTVTNVAKAVTLVDDARQALESMDANARKSLSFVQLKPTSDALRSASRLLQEHLPDPPKLVEVQSAEKAGRLSRAPTFGKGRYIGLGTFKRGFHTSPMGQTDAMDAVEAHQDESGHGPSGQDREPVKVMNQLQDLHISCADLLLRCPRPFSVETREIYNMAKVHFELSGKPEIFADYTNTRGRELDKFRKELESWEGEPMLVL